MNGEGKEEGYVDKIQTFAIMLLSGMTPEDLKKRYNAMDEEIQQARNLIGQNVGEIAKSRKVPIKITKHP